MSTSPSEEYPRGRDTSVALTEVRTVLSRAENARERLGWATEPAGSWQTHDYHLIEDPDAAEMRAALDEVIASLDRWRRIGRKRNVDLSE